MKGKNSSNVGRSNPSLSQILQSGGTETRLSALVMGLGCLLHKQVIKGALYLAIEIAFVMFMIRSGFHSLAMLAGLGSVPQKEVWNEELQVYLYTKGDQSILILLNGLGIIMIIVLFFVIWRAGMRMPYTLMTPPMFFIIVLTILPLVYMICMAFTNYSKIDNHLVLFDWVGLRNFATLFDRSSVLGGTFWKVLIWTLVWAFFATFTNYFFGMILAILINRKDTKIKGFWRFCFVLSCAVPMFVSLLIMRTMLQPEGAVNVMLRNVGLIPAGSSLPFFTNATWARITVIVINIWVGVPYTLLQLTGVLQNIPADLYEAAEVDGANQVQQFFSITLPYMFYVTTPYLIATFTANVNNFNVIYLLSGGDPVTNLASTAGDTDLLVTWLYKLTIEKQYYNIGAVVGILTFVILAVGSLLTYRNTKSYKEEGGF